MGLNEGQVKNRLVPGLGMHPRPLRVQMKLSHPGPALIPRQRQRLRSSTSKLHLGAHMDFLSLSSTPGSLASGESNRRQRNLARLRARHSERKFRDAFGSVNFSDQGPELQNTSCLHLRTLYNYFYFDTGRFCPANRMMICVRRSGSDRFSS